jgi:hypothetical protein
LTTKKYLLLLPKFEVGHIPSQARCGTAAGFLIPGLRMLRTPPSQQSAAERAKILTKPFPNDAHLEAWAARMIAAAEEFQRNKRSDPLGGFVLR